MCCEGVSIQSYFSPIAGTMLHPPRRATTRRGHPSGEDGSWREVDRKKTGGWMNGERREEDATRAQPFQLRQCNPFFVCLL